MLLPHHRTPPVRSACARGLVAALLLCATAPAALAAPPLEKDERAAVIGQPVALDVAPGDVKLVGVRDARQLVVSGKYSDGTVRDLTAVADLRVEPAGVVDLQEGGFLRPKKNGTATVTVGAGGKVVKVPVAVSGLDQPAPVSFRRDVIAALNVGGCNMGACHGTPSGKNGFKLSLRGFDPAADFVQLTRDQFGRRSGKHDAEQSLLLIKGIGRVPHEGGQRYGATSVPAEMIAAWLAEGTRDDAPALAGVKKVDVVPGARVLRAPAKWQQLAVNVTFADNVSRDVTRLTNFSSSDPSIADVTPNGLVEFKRSGEVAVLCRYLEEMVSVRLTYLEPREGFAWPNPPEANYVDTHTFAKLKQMSIAPSDLCTDFEFVRRAYLDAIGRMPTVEESKAFLADKDAKKREKLIDALVEAPEFADFWALKWADVLRSSRKTIQTKGSYGFQAWLRGHFQKNTPWDKVVQELITANGNTFANPPANYYRIAKDPQSLAETTAQLFLGVRMQCAKCHNHPFERWSQDDYYGMAAWFARVKTKPEPAVGTPAAKNAGAAEVIYASRDGEVQQPRSGKTMKPRYIGTGDADVKPTEDRRAVLAAWLTSGDNAFFSKSVVNRVWFHLLGKGIVDPVDDFRESNPSCNDELLDALAKDFAKNKFDMKLLVRTIMKSRTYQLSAQPNASNADDTKYFSHAVTKLLTAEQLLDAICDFTGVPEKFAGLPAGTRATQLPDGEVNHPFLKAFGQPARELACECERESDGNLAQALQLINGPTVNEKVRGANNRLGKLLAAKATDEQILTELFTAALARAPFEDEKKISLGHVARGADKRKAWEDVVWALINTREFLFRH
ncbi:Ig-like domain-containing protein OS=Singulisphaera acidiphila (strain ATCC BAA-1392 / DSM 18658 / VKM B-2454 / MOB10) GN=Sinac_2724 PE=4 SV=1: Big_2: PSCyt2: PSD1 [Gemmataceae bacterium]|nr:Ig-like domain-containing protein OS=Singulisphaera acidiphila (strain ATCC BAA-1392 / DSM 18658 / VKM B-2454 / MOB10) GN=Sinac_2724 PE=4 SV=1: Big_2: PSCyt2: PSD1 [Gemmataceae bacterium]VTT97759.1 Ig-like domain-containing protein OS=Singulisphaera acidiphila (strain ATCC BAA-1392 / DSM 18658 / VKM B-2454 / MOB10) GN=Sinac_2724 PE=4 SV=1: Big_2: PSCyt2: PSD1 [Gemmataceae bacterium]